MSQLNPAPRLDTRGAVDLSSLARPAAPQGPSSTNAVPLEPGAVPASVIVDVTEATFADLVQLSTQLPVLVDLWSSRSPVSDQLSPVLEKVALSYGGRLLLAKIDADANPQIVGAFQVQSIPTAIAVLAGQPIPLFQGNVPEAQIREVVEELLKAAEANGVTARIAVDGVPEAPSETPEPELPPLHQEAFDAIEAGDFDAAIAAYRKALTENPRDDFAKAGLAQVSLLARTQGVDLQAVRTAAANDPKDVAAALAVADVDMLGGQVSDAFDRLIELVKRVGGDDKESLRLRLVEYFEIVGQTDPRVGAARRALTNALY